MKNIIKNIITIGAISLATSAFAQISTPLYVYNLEPVTDEFNRVMKGNATDTAANRSLVEIRTAPGGVVYAPAVDGSPAAANTLIATSGIGMNTSPNAKNTGTFCAVLTKRPTQGSAIFARVYNASSIAAASFYVDSAVVVVPAQSETMVEFVFGSAQPFDSADDDGDGLCNSLEKSLGSNPNSACTLNSGIDDLTAFLAGFDFNDPNSGLHFEDVEFAFSDGVAAFTWNSAPGRTYKVHMTESLTEPNFAQIGEAVIATGAIADLAVPISSLPYASGFFKVEVTVNPSSLTDIPAMKFVNLK